MNVQQLITRLEEPDIDPNWEVHAAIDGFANLVDDVDLDEVRKRVYLLEVFPHDQAEELAS